jgi:hypothetical protein
VQEGEKIKFEKEEKTPLYLFSKDIIMYYKKS